MDNEALAYLAPRLEAVAKGPFCEVAVLVRKVMASTSPALQKPDAEHALTILCGNTFLRRWTMRNTTW
jgi:hypothetical protein